MATNFIEILVFLGFFYFSKGVKKKISDFLEIVNIFKNK